MRDQTPACLGVVKGDDGLRMRKRRKYVLVGIALVVVGLVVAFIPSREPSYGGKRLSEWVESYRRVLILPGPNLDLKQAREAGPIRHIGTNAIPYLLKWIAYESPPWKFKLYGLRYSILTAINPHWRVFDPKQSRADGAIRAFRVLGPVAEEAIPELARILSKPNATRSAERAVDALTGLGDAGLRPLMAALRNPAARTPHRFYIALRICQMGTTMREAALPALQHLLMDPDPGMRATATNLFLQFAPEVLQKVYQD